MAYSWLVPSNTPSTKPKRISGFMSAEEFGNGTVISFDFSQLFDIPTDQSPLKYVGPDKYFKLAPDNESVPIKESLYVWDNRTVSPYRKGCAFLSNNDANEKPIIDYPWLNSFSAAEGSDETTGILLNRSGMVGVTSFDSFYLAERNFNQITFNAYHHAGYDVINSDEEYSISVSKGYNITTFSNNFLMGIFYALTSKNRDTYSMIINDVECRISLAPNNNVKIGLSKQIIPVDPPGVNKFTFLLF